MSTNEHSSPCIRRRTLGALGLTGAAAAALTGCGPDRGGIQNEQIDADTSGAVDLASIPENATSVVDFGGDRGYVAVVRGAGDDLKGYSGYCTHQGCALSAIDSGNLHCPCHDSEFTPADGAPTQGPAVEPLPEVKLAVADGKVTRVDA